MKNFCSIALLAAFILGFASTDAEAQRFNRRRAYNTVSLQLNAMNYFGDIVPESDFTSMRLKSTRPNLGITYAHRFSPRVSVRGGLAWGRITGDDQKSASPNEADNLPRFQRNLSFRNDIKELSVVAMVDLFENRGTYLKRPDFSPYAFGGVAVFAHNPKTELNGSFVALQPLGTEGQYATNRVNPNGENYPDPYSKVQIAIPFGFGVRYKLDNNWDLGFEIGWRKTFTDYLDDVSSSYADPNDLTEPNAAVLANRSGNDPSHMPGMQRGDRTDKDWYIVTGLNLNYILPTNIKSPKFR